MASLARKIEKQPEYELLNTNKLAMRFDLDRATVRKRLEANNVQPIEVKARETIYKLTPTVAAILSKIDSPLDEAKLRKETAQAELFEFKAQQQRGEVVPFNEVIDTIQRLFGAVYKEIAVRQPQRIAAKLARAKTAAQSAKIIKGDTDRVFKTLRDDFEKYLK